MLRRLMLLSVAGLVLVTGLASAQGAELDRFKGDWKVVELVEDGKTIPEEVISEWLPSGGRFTIEDNAVQFTDHTTGKKQLKLFSIDETQSPKGIDFQTREKERETWGIYRFDGDRIVLCLAHPEESERPTTFSAKAGSKHMLMTLERTGGQKVAAKPAPVGPKAISSNQEAPRFLTDAEAAKAVTGTWRLTDAMGVLIATLSPDGTFSNVREVTELRLFKKTLVQTPVSTGTWTVKNGQILFHVLSATQLDRLNHKYAFTLRSFSDTDMIYVDPYGQVGRAVRVR